MAARKNVGPRLIRRTPTSTSLSTGKHWFFGPTITLSGRNWSFFSTSIGRRLAGEDLASRDIFLILEQDYGIPLGHADVVVGAHLADRSQGELLGINEGAPVLLIDRLTFSESGKPIDYEHLFYRGDLFRYQMKVKRGDARQHDC